MKSYMILLLGSIALQSFALGNDATQLPTGASDLVPDPRFEQYQPVSPKVKVAEWKMDFSEMDLEYEGQDSNVGSAIPFQIIKEEVDVDDRLKIIAVHLVSSEKLEIGSTLEVVGTYKLGSADDARLGLSITSEEKGGRHRPAPEEMMDITKGQGSFRLLRKVDRHGGIHLSIYPREASGHYGQSTSRLYFLELNK